MIDNFFIQIIANWMDITILASCWIAWVLVKDHSELYKYIIIASATISILFSPIVYFGNLAINNVGPNYILGFVSIFFFKFISGLLLLAGLYFTKEKQWINLLSIVYPFILFFINILLKVNDIVFLILLLLGLVLIRRIKSIGGL